MRGETIYHYKPTEIKMVDPYWKVEDQNVYQVYIVSRLQKGPIPIWDIARTRHVAANAYYPEHYDWLNHMTPVDKRQLLVNMLATFLVGPWKNNHNEWTIAEAAYMLKDWQNWKLVKEYYVGDYTFTSREVVKRWPTDAFTQEKDVLISWFQALMKREIKMKSFINGLYLFDSVQSYVNDLIWHEWAVSKVVTSLFPDDQELKKKIEMHNNKDLWDAFMVTANTLRWIFGVQDVNYTANSETNEKWLSEIEKCGRKRSPPVRLLPDSLIKKTK